MKGNKTSKILVPVLLASVAGTMLSTNARDIRVFAADEELLSTYITVSNFNKTGKVGDEYTLPTVEVESGYTSEMELVDPRGATLKTYKESGTIKNIETKFVPAHSGTYTLKYKVLKNSAVVSTTDTMKIEVSSSEYNIEMPTNSKYVILDTVKTGTIVRIPAPTLKKDGEEDEITKLTVTVTGEDNVKSAPLTLSQDQTYYEYTVATAGVYEIEYRYEDAGVNQVTKSQRFVAKDNFDYSKIKLSMSYSSTRPTTGVIGNSVTLPKVSVVDTNNGSSSINSYVDIKVFYRGTSANRLTTPEAVEVKDYAFTPKKAGDYSVSYQAYITYYDANGEHKIETVTSTFEISDVKDSEAPVPMAVNSYKVDDQGKITEIATSYSTDSNGEVIATYAAVPSDATEEDILELLGSRNNAIPSTVTIKSGESSVKVAIPAIYATDNAFDSGVGLVYTRSVKDEHGTITTINKGFDGTTTVTNGEIAYYTFTSAGTYTLRYKAADGEESSSNYDVMNFTIKVENESNFKADTPKVTLQSFSEYAYTDTNLVFAKPTASDTYDARMDVVTTYKLTAGSCVSAEYTLTKDNVNEDGKYELNLEEIIKSAIENDETFKSNNITESQVTRITVTATATNDSGNTGSAVRAVDLINTLDDNKPERVTNGETFNSKILEKNTGVKDVKSFAQRSKIMLPDVEFSNVQNSVVSANVVVTNPNGSKVTVYNGYSETNDSQNLVIKNGYFTAEYAGVYTIKYCVKNSGGNAVYAVYQIEVQLTETPELYLANVSEFENEVKQLGTEIFPPKAGLYVNGKYLTPDDSDDNITVETSWEIAPVKWEDVKDDILPAGNLTETEKQQYKENWELENRTTMPEVTKVNGKNVSFTAYTAGVYTIRYTGSYTVKGGDTVYVENERTIRVTVKDSTKPSIEILDNEYKTFPQYVQEYTANEKVYIPGFKVTGSYDMDSVKRSVEVTGYDGKSITATYIKALEEYTDAEITQIVKEANPKGDGEEDSAYNTRIDAAIAEFKEEHTTYAGMYSFIPNGNGTHTVYYVAVDGNGNEVKSDACYVYVGDCENPTLDFGSTDVQESIIPTSVKQGSDFELNMNDLVKYCTDNKSSIEDGTLKVTAVLRNSSGTKQTNLFGSDSTRYKWNLSESGNYTLTITLTDEAGKTTSKEFTIESKTEESKETKVKEVVGIVLIVVSLAILAGVIVYFVVTGRKMRPGSTKSKKNKGSKK